MYGPSEGEFLCALLVFAVIVGLIFIGGEHLVLWLWNHVHITWGVR